MPSYEKVIDGVVVETVHTVDGSNSDTELGVLALDGVGGWRLQDPYVGPEVEPVEQPESAPADEPDPAPAKPARARRR